MAEPETILVVEDEESIREILSSLLEMKGYSCFTAPNGAVALSMVDESPGRYRLVISDVMMPKMNGLVLLSNLLERHPDLPVVMLSAMQDIHVATDAIRKGAYDYLVKPIDKDQLFISVARALERRRLIEENRRYQRDLELLVEERTRRLAETLSQLERSYELTLEALGNALDLKDSGTEGHSKRVTAYTIAIARAMKIGGEELKNIARGAYLHDIGKIGIPDSILHKPGPLTDAERTVMRTHCARGFQILQRISFLKEASEIVLSHQEFYDGTGYPRGLKGEEIHMGARVFAVADALDAMLSDRPYRKAMPVSHAIEEIQRVSGTQFDPKVVEAFCSLPPKVWEDLRSSVGEGYGLAAAEKLSH